MCSFLVLKGVSSPVLQVGRSILQGCFSSVSMTKGYVYNIIEHLHYQLTTPIQVYIDDVTIRAEGSASMVVQNLVCAGVALTSKLDEVGLVAAGKSVITASHPGLAEVIQKELAAQGVHFRAVGTARDLGVDTGRLGARVQPIMKTRFGKFARRAARLRVFQSFLKKSSPALRRSKQLWSGGVLAVARYGQAAFGVSPSSMVRLRLGSLACCGITGQHLCPTTAIHLCFGVDGDPLVAYLKDLFMQWFRFLADKVLGEQRLRACWRKLTLRLAAPNRWNLVRGPMGAVIATLLDLEWEPLHPDEWRAPGQAVLRFSNSVRCTRSTCGEFL